MSITMMIYLASVAGNISTVLFIFNTIFIILYSFAWIIISMERHKYNMPHRKAIIYFSISTILLVVMPNEKTIYLMAATSIAEDISKNPQVINRMDKVIKIIDSKLDDEIASMKKGK